MTSAHVPSRPFDVVALDAMGVLYRNADDVADLLVPYARSRGSRLPAADIEARYRECSLGRMTSAELWQQLDTSGARDAEYCRRHQLTDGVMPLLRTLTQLGLRLACLSNDVAEWSWELRRRFGLAEFIDTWLISGEAGVRKPAPGAYQALLRAVDTPADRVLFVDDRPANVAAATAAGLRAVRYGADGAQAEDGLRARDMTELEKVIRTWS